MGKTDEVKLLMELGQARIEERHSNIKLESLRAQAKNIKLTRGLIFVLVFSLISWTNSGLNIQNIIEETNYPLLVGLLIVVVLMWIVSGYVAEPFARAVITITGFSLSIEPGSHVKNYVYSGATKVGLAILGTGANLVYLLILYFGMSNTIRFFLPSASIPKISVPFLLLALAIELGLVIFPATRINVMDYPDLLKSLVIFDQIEVFKLKVEFRKAVVRTAIPIVSVQLAEQIAAQGVRALDTWLNLTTSTTDMISAALGQPKNYITGGKTATVDGERLVALTDINGGTTIHNYPELGSGNK